MKISKIETYFLSDKLDWSNFFSPWTIMVNLFVIINNLCVRSGEWKDAKKTFQLMLIGLGIIILASGLLGYTNTLS